MEKSTQRAGWEAESPPEGVAEHSDRAEAGGDLVGAGWGNTGE